MSDEKTDHCGASDSDRDTRQETDSAGASESGSEVGNAAPKAWWPVLVCGALWATWIVFLLVIALGLRDGS